MSKAAILLKQLKASNPKARADAVSGFNRRLYEPDFSIEKGRTVGAEGDVEGTA
jgi:hypothetical protein